MFCTKCGSNVIDPEGDFCGECGSALIKKEASGPIPNTRNEMPPSPIWAASLLSYIVSSLWFFLVLIHLSEFKNFLRVVVFLILWIIAVSVLGFLVSHWIFLRKTLGYRLRLLISLCNSVLSVLYIITSFIGGYMFGIDFLQYQFAFILLFAAELAIVILLLVGRKHFNIKKSNIIKFFRSIRYLLQLHDSDFEEVPDSQEENNAE